MGPAGRHDTGRGLAWEAAAAAAPQVSAEGDSLTAVRTPSTAKTAWFPFRQEIGWEEAATSAAVTWTNAECSVRGVKGLLLVYSHAHDYDHGPLGSFAKRHSITTQRSYRQHPGSGVVLVDCPELTLMDTAVRAGRSVLCAIERPDFPLLGWAMETAAENLLTGEVTPDTRSEEQKKLLEHLATAGNNGWHDDLSKTTLPGRLAKLRASGLPPEVIWGTMLARGASVSGIQELQRYLAKT